MDINRGLFISLTIHLLLFAPPILRLSLHTPPPSREGEAMDDMENRIPSKETDEERELFVFLKYIEKGALPEEAERIGKDSRRVERETRNRVEEPDDLSLVNLREDMPEPSPSLKRGQGPGRASRGGRVGEMGGEARRPAGDNIPLPSFAFRVVPGSPFRNGSPFRTGRDEGEAELIEPSPVEEGAERRVSSDCPLSRVDALSPEARRSGIVFDLPREEYIRLNTKESPYYEYISIIYRRIMENLSYPESMRFSGETARVGVEFTVLKNGRVTGPKVVRSSGRPEFDRAALQAVLSASPLPRIPDEYGRGRFRFYNLFRFRDRDF